MGKKPRKVAYVVRRGRKTGIFYTWGECDEQVKGFPDNNYEGYTVLGDAERAWEKHLRDLQDIANKASMNETPQRKENQGMRCNLDYHALLICSFADSNSPRGEKPQFKRPLSLDSDDSDEDGPSKRRFNVSDPRPDTMCKEEETIVLTAEQEAVVKMALEGRNIFLTGAGGSGKTATVKEILARFKARGTKVQVVAPTGIAALPLKGVTTYSFLGWKPDSLRIPIKRLAENSKTYIRKRIKKLAVLIIDEISMVENQFLDRMDTTLQAIMESTLPFGGKRVIFVGDFHQLPPVKPFQFCLKCGYSMSPREPFRCIACKLPEFTEGDKWAFKSSVWKNLNLRHVQLQQIHRQKDDRFQTILNKIRNGIYLDDDEWRVLEGKKKNHDPKFCAVRLMARKTDVDEVNRKELAAIKTPSMQWKSLDFRQNNALAEDHFKNHRLPETLTLKIGAKVVLLTNLNLKRGLVNGSQGEVVGFEDIEEEPTGNVTFDKRQTIQFHARSKLAPVVRFTNGITKTISAVATSSLVGSRIQDELYESGPKVVCRTQIPLILGWALTIHKSQGMTLEYLEVSSKYIFERGQLYVALSRGTSLEGTTLTGYTREQLPVDSDVVEFYENTEWEALGPAASAVQEKARPREPSPELEEETDYDD
jgi:ATP-dependent DNA helicase PIF1